MLLLNDLGLWQQLSCCQCKQAGAETVMNCAACGLGAHPNCLQIPTDQQVLSQLAVQMAAANSYLFCIPHRHFWKAICCLQGCCHMYVVMDRNQRRTVTWPHTELPLRALGCTDASKKQGVLGDCHQQVSLVGSSLTPLASQ